MFSRTEAPAELNWKELNTQLKHLLKGPLSMQSVVHGDSVTPTNLCKYGLYSMILYMG